MRVNAPGLTVKDVWDALTATYGVAGSYAKLIEDNLDSQVSLAKADLSTLETRLSAARALLLDNLDAPIAATVAALLDELAKDHTTAGSIAELIKWALGDRFALCDHFEAVTLADLPIPYSENVIGGGASFIYLDNEASALKLSSGAALNDGIEVTSDRTVSLAALGGTKIVIEARLKVNSEANIRWGMGLRNATTDVDMAAFHMDTGQGAPQPNGTIQSFVDGVGFYTDLGLAATYDLTAYHVYRLEVTPGTRIDAYVDNNLEGSEITGAEVPVDQSFVVYLPLFTRVAANKDLIVDYYKVWSE